MERIPGHPLRIFLTSTTDRSTGLSSENHLMLYHADVILGRDRATQEEFVVYGREILKQVAAGDDEAEGYNVLCIEIDRNPGDPDLELLLALVELTKGKHEYLDHGSV